MDLELRGRVALVTGAHRGTGQIIAQRLGQEGATVLVHGFTETQARDSCATIGLGHPVAGDLTCDAGADAIVQACLTHVAGVDILVNNYGTTSPGTWADSDTAAWLDMYEKNVLSMMRLSQRLLPTMQRNGWGRIINLGTVGSTRPNARMPHYYAAKGALATATVSLAKAVGGSGVRVNLVSPGLIHTAEVEAAYLEQGRRRGWGDTWAEVAPQMAKDIPIGRIVRREEVADLVAFLASTRADAIHGQNIRIDGGALDVLT
jgi:NAD(P)-dependent dehydrogenase (short-subunit alcohol dehydrogenase family)